MGESFSPFDEFSHRLIQRKARQMIGKAGFRQQDCEDIEQELILRLLTRMTAFDPERGEFPAFVTMVLRSLVANLLREKQQQRELRSASPWETSQPPITDIPDSRRPRGEHLDFTLDLAELQNRLSQELRQLLDDLQHAESLSGLAKELGIPRTTLAYRLEKLRQVFENQGFRDYLQFPSSF